ncbi:MAG: ATP-binding cassette domain-containing protein [Erysipelothrix sp.]|nr:ATP-binding cassette domain-containing protein [Erysipelothrix sp.]
MSKRYKKQKGLKYLNLELKAHMIYGLLGRNGAGKSTIMNLMARRIFPSSGLLKISGVQLKEGMNLSPIVHLLSEENYYNIDVKIASHFKNIHDLNEHFDIENAYRIAELFKLDSNQKLKSLSTGYLTIFKLCIALSIRVDVLLLDEPIKGLDANHRELFYSLHLEYYQNHNNTIVISSHIIDEITNLIEEVIVIEDGNIILEQSVEYLLNHAYLFSGKYEEVIKTLNGLIPLHIERKAFETRANILTEIENMHNL